LERSEGRRDEKHGEIGTDVSPLNQDYLFDADDTVLLVWDYHPFRHWQRRGRLFFALAAMAAIWVLAYLWLGPPGLLLSMAFTILPSAVQIFPTRYVLTERGVRLINWVSRDRQRWSAFESYVLYRDAVQLLFNQRSLRGWLLKGHLLFFAGNKDEVVELVNRFVRPR